MSEQKIYINGIGIKKIEFKNGGHLLKLNINFEKFGEAMRPHVNEKGYVNVVISPRKTPGKNGETHTMFVDLWKPNPEHSRASSRPGSSFAEQEKREEARAASPDEDKLPF